jgi:predicted PurR-regulated permease PerM
VKDKFWELPPWQQGLLLLTGGTLLILAAIWMITVRHLLFSALAPFLAALIIAYLLAPLVNFMERRRISRPLAIAVLYLLFALVIFIFSVRVTPLFLDDLGELVRQLPEYGAALQKFLHRIEAGYHRFNLPPNIREMVENSGEAFSTALALRLEHLYDFIFSLFGGMIIFLLVPVLTYYFLRDEDSFKRGFLYLFPPHHRRRIVAAAEEINGALGAFIRGSLLVSLAVAMLSYAGLLILGVKFPLVLALVIGVTNLIPYIGPVIGALPAWLVAFLEAPLLSLKVALLILIVQQIECQFIAPVILGRSARLHPLVIILALLLGGKLFGFIGLLLAVPAALVLRILGKHLLMAWRGGR